MLEAISGARRIVVCNVAGALYALDGECPHRGGPLAHGALHGTTVVCPWHAWEFDCESGRNGYDPAIRLQTFDVAVNDGDIIVDVP